MRISHTFCASDSLTHDGGYFMAAWTDSTGDSIGVRRGILGALGVRYYNKDQRVSTSVLPTCAIYKEGNNKYSAVAHAGYGPENVYFNNEGLNPVSVESSPDLPSGFALEQNYPNPFNPTTSIKYTVGGTGEAGAGGQGPGSRKTMLVVYDLLGRQVATLVDESKAPGSYEVSFDGSRLSSGVYYYRLTSGTFSQTRAMMIIK